MAAGPAGGFIFGLLNAGDPDPNPVGRFFYACMMAVQTPLHAGFPPRVEAQADHAFKVWPHIALSYVLIQGWFVFREVKRDRKPKG
jgi:hypothetical protein